MGRVIVVTGSEGYLASQAVDRFLASSDVAYVIGVDVRPHSRRNDPRYRYIALNVLDPNLAVHLDGQLPEDRSETSLMHAAWWFDPTKDVERQDAVDIGGTENVLDAVRRLGIPHVFYLGSTTAYAPLKSNPWQEPFLSEEDWERCAPARMDAAYRYARNKALAYAMMMDFSAANPGILTGWINGSIVIGANTRNVVSYVAESPFTLGLFMFSILGSDPPMQFIAEHDITEVLYRAMMERWKGSVNVAGRGTVRYSEVCRILGRIRIPVPALVLYPIVDLLWQIGLLRFPSSLLTLIHRPWVADIRRLREEFGFEPAFTSKEALAAFARARLEK